jgi:hypothetical protein
MDFEILHPKNALQPSIVLGNLRIDEPVTMLTDFVVTAVCFYAFWHLRKSKKSFEFLKYHFLGMALATFLGGLIGHGFLYAFSFGWKLPGWLLSMLSVALLERTVIDWSKPYITKKLGAFFTKINLVELCVFILLTFSTLNFHYVEIHSAYGVLMVVGSFSFLLYSKTKSITSKYLLSGVLLSGISGVVFLSKIGFSEWFNHLDCSHVLMAAAAFCFYKSAKNHSFS